MNLFGLDSSPSPLPLSQKYSGSKQINDADFIAWGKPSKSSMTIEEIPTQTSDPPPQRSFAQPPSPRSFAQSPSPRSFAQSPPSRSFAQSPPSRSFSHPLDAPPSSDQDTGLPDILSALAAKRRPTNSPAVQLPHSDFTIGRIPRNIPTTIELRELDLNLIYPSANEGTKNYFMDQKSYGSKIAIIGKPGSGKSVLAKYLCFAKRHMFPVVQIHSGTENENGFYGDFVPRAFIFNELDYGNIKKFIMRQKLMKHNLLKNYDVKNPWAMLIKDDVMKDTKVLRDTTHEEVLKNGRHWKMLYVLIMQYCLDLDPKMRTCFDGAFILHEDQKSNLKKLYDNFASTIPTFALFCDIMKSMTKDYRALYVSNDASISGDWRDKVFWFKAERVDKFKMCCSEAWDYSNSIYDHEKATRISGLGDEDLMKSLRGMMKQT